MANGQLDGVSVVGDNLVEVDYLDNAGREYRVFSLAGWREGEGIIKHLHQMHTITPNDRWQICLVDGAMFEVVCIQSKTSTYWQYREGGIREIDYGYMQQEILKTQPIRPMPPWFGEL